MVVSPQAIGRWSTAEIHDTVAAIARQPAYATPLRRSLLGRALVDLADQSIRRSARPAQWLARVSVDGDHRDGSDRRGRVVGRIVISRQVDVLGRGDGRRARLSSERRDFWAMSRELAAAEDYHRRRVTRSTPR